MRLIGEILLGILGLFVMAWIFAGITVGGMILLPPGMLLASLRVLRDPPRA